jgi:hypothetical protein
MIAKMIANIMRFNNDRDHDHDHNFENDRDHDKKKDRDHPNPAINLTTSTPPLRFFYPDYIIGKICTVVRFLTL